MNIAEYKKGANVIKRIFMLGAVIVVTFNLMACASASSQSTKGVDCNYSGQRLEDMPLACQGR